MRLKLEKIGGMLLLASFALLNACGSDAPEMSRLSTSATILAFGDSLTEGYGVKEHESYPAVLQELSGRKVINAGISGEESGPGLRRLPAALTQHKPDLLILCHGGNDLLRKRSLSQMETNIRSMIELAQSKNIPVLLIGVPKPGFFLSSLEVYEKIASDMGVVYIDNLIPDVLGDSSMKSDTVHPNAKGYRVMAETINKLLKDSGAL